MVNSKENDRLTVNYLVTLIISYSMYYANLLIRIVRLAVQANNFTKAEQKYANTTALRNWIKETKTKDRHNKGKTD